MRFLRTFWYHFRANIINKKYLASMALIFCTVYLICNPIYQASEYYNLNINIGVIAIVINSAFMINILFVSALLFFSDLPVRYPDQVLLLARSSKRKWLLSQFLYVIVISVLMAAFFVISIVIVCRGSMYIDDSWGKIITSMTQQEFLTKFEMGVTASAGMLSAVSPYEAIVWCLSGLILTWMMFGFIAIILNLYVAEFAGILVNGLMVFVRMMIGFFGMEELCCISPIHWCTTSILYNEYMVKMPSTTYVLAVRLAVLMGLLIAAIILSGKKMDLLRYLERARS